MYLFYIDESGSPYSYSNYNEYFVLSAVILHDKHWEVINTKISHVKRKYFPSSDLSQIELKGSRIWSATKDFEGFDAAKKDNILKDICSIINDCEIKIISIVVFKKSYVSNHPDKDMLTDVWKYMLERVEMFLTGEGQREHGLIIMDSVNHVEDKKRDKTMDSFKMFGTGRVSLNHVLEITYTDSGLKNIIQLTDIVSFITRLHMRNDTKEIIENHWKIIEQKLRTDLNGNYFGVGLKYIK